jgi:CHAT domain-containing protein
LWLCPYARLWSIPFAALYDGRRHLVEQHELTLMPGSSAASRCKAQRSDEPFVAPVVVGCSDDGLLAHTVDEARAVASCLPSPRLLVESQATLANVRSAAQDADLIHLAVHGRFRADAPLFSSLRLHDGWLTADELSEWRLPAAELVVLSACESGQSRPLGSDLLGLARGFARASAHQLLAGHWAVDDRVTLDWMRAFYKTLRAGQTIAVSHRAAQLTILTRHPHPWHWAAFDLLSLT